MSEVVRVREIRERFRERLMAKTGWGRNEVMREFESVIAELSLPSVEPNVECGEPKFGFPFTEKDLPASPQW